MPLLRDYPPAVLFEAQEVHHASYSPLFRALFDPLRRALDNVQS
jgi:hypothetical protein